MDQRPRQQPSTDEIAARADCAIQETIRLLEERKRIVAYWDLVRRGDWADDEER
jgi:hypothetical protein